MKSTENTHKIQGEKIMADLYRWKVGEEIFQGGWPILRVEKLEQVDPGLPY